MAEVTLLKLRLRGGDITTIQVEEILEYDGKPFLPADSVRGEIDGVIDALNHLQGRVDALENSQGAILKAIVSPTKET